MTRHDERTDKPSREAKQKSQTEKPNRKATRSCAWPVQCLRTSPQVVPSCRMVKPSRSQEASGDVERLPCEAHALVHASGQTVTRSLGRQLGIQLVRKRRSRTTLSPRRRKARETSKASRHARARPEMRPFRPHRRNPARTVLPLDGSRGVESPGIESIGTRRSVASRSLPASKLPSRCNKRYGRGLEDIAPASKGQCNARAAPARRRSL